MWGYFGLASELGFLIALPLIALVLVGHALDAKFGTKVVFTLLGMAIALGVSSYAIWRKIKKINQEL